MPVPPGGTRPTRLPPPVGRPASRPRRLRLGYHATRWVSTAGSLLANSDAARRRANTARDYADEATITALPLAA